MRVRFTNATVLGWILLASLLGACGASIDGSCELDSGTFRVPNHGRIWHVDYEPAGLDEVKLHVTMDVGGGETGASLQMSSPESWVAITESGSGPDYQLILVPWSDGADDIAWSQGEGEQDSPMLFKRVRLGCSDGLGYAALPGHNDQVTLFSKNDAGEWDQIAVVDLITGGVIAGFNADR